MDSSYTVRVQTIRKLKKIQQMITLFQGLIYTQTSMVYFLKKVGVINSDTIYPCEEREKILQDIYKKYTKKLVEEEIEAEKLAQQFWEKHFSDLYNDDIIKK